MEFPMIDQLMKQCAELGLEIDPKPDYPLQLFFSQGEFCAAYEPNMDSLIEGIGKTAEEALNKLIQAMILHIGKDIPEANSDNTFDVAYHLSSEKFWVHSSKLSYVWDSQMWTRSVPSACELDEDYRQMNNPALAKKIIKHALGDMSMPVPDFIHLRKPSLGLPFTPSSKALSNIFEAI
jgi:hypothetical protein